MDGWLSLKLNFETTLENGYLVMALSHLDRLINSASATSDVTDLLTNHTLRGIATLHYLAGFPYQEEDIPRLDKLIRIFTASGYDVNKVTDDIFSPNQDGSMEAPGYTALMASVEQNNLILLECLLRHGARADIQDAVGLTPCHWAIKNGNLKWLQKFFEHGGAALVTSAFVDKGSGDDKLLSILHEAVDKGHVEILRYLLTKEELGVDIKSLLMAVERWGSLKLELDKALEVANLAEVLSHRDALIFIASCSSHVRTLLKNHTVKDLPTLHYLVRFPFREEDMPQLDQLIQIFIDFDYDINKTTDYVRMSGLTALLASVEQQNLILVECLLRKGAQTNIRTPAGFSPYHRAIQLGDIECLQKLVELGGRPMTSTSSDKSVHPVLHTAIDEGHTEMVLYLLSKELGVDVNEESIYKMAVNQPPYYTYEYFFGISNRVLRKIDEAFTPLGRALSNGATQTFEALMTHPGAKRSQFKILHSFLVSGDTEKALDLLKYFSDEELSTDKIKDEWALLCINPKAFKEERHVEFTKKLILEYVRRGWDANSKSTFVMLCSVTLFDGTELKAAFGRYTLLHLACLNGGHEIVKALVEEVGMDINCKTGGNTKLTPLQILLISKEWGSAAYLMDKGADLNLRGSYDGQTFTRFMRKDLITGKLELNDTFNSVELLVRMGYEEGLRILDKMLTRPEMKLHGGNEFHLAIEGKNVTYCMKVLQHCTKIISKEDLNWITDCGWSNGKNPVKLSSLIWLLSSLKENRIKKIKNDQALADLIKLMAELGCDLNISRIPKPFLDNEAELLIFYILRYDLVHNTSNLLLRTILQFDSLRLSLLAKWGEEKPVDHLISQWNDWCCPWRRNPHKIVEAIHLLVINGLDISGMVIDGNFKYHNGSMAVLKILYRAGAKILDGFFTSTTACKQFFGGESGLTKEKEELKKWKEEFDLGNRMSLGHLCRLQVRKMLKCIGDLKMLDEIPKSLKAAVLCQEPTLLKTVTVCGQEFDWEDSSDYDNYNDIYHDDEDNYDYYVDYDSDVDFDD